jgi:hypothetical protein
MTTFMHPGMTCPKDKWIVMDYTNNVVWLYYVDGRMFVVATII